MRLNYIPTELSCTVVRVKILTEMESKNNKEGNIKYDGRRISRKRHTSNEEV
jgi:hypothetical protein